MATTALKRSATERQQGTLLGIPSVATATRQGRPASAPGCRRPKMSVISTTMFGSASSSPLPLTVEVTAWSDTVPSAFALPGL